MALLEGRPPTGQASDVHALYVLCGGERMDRAATVEWFLGASSDGLASPAGMHSL